MWPSRNFRLALALAAVLAIGSSLAGMASPQRTAAATSNLKIVFAALDRDNSGNTTGMQAIYVANGDGTNVRRITPPGDGKFYDWPMWAMNGTKILYTARTGPLAGVPEQIYLMNPDGTGVVQLTNNAWRNGQPKMSADGSRIIFTSFWKEFPVVGLYQLSLATGEIVNLSARHSFDSGFDSDPFWSPDGQQVIFASSRGEDGNEQPTQVYLMNADGTDRRRLTDDTYFNTDPVLHPDGKTVAIAAYTGEGAPTAGRQGDDFTLVRLHDWSLVIKDIETQTSRHLTGGQNCTVREITNPCTIAEASAWVPKWTPDGAQVGFISILSPNRTGIYAMNPDGSNGRAVLEFADKAVTRFDWTAADAPGQPSTPELPALASPLLFGGRVYASVTDGAELPEPQLFAGQSDRWLAAQIVPQQESKQLAPITARWTPDKQRILFTARVPVDRNAPPPPPPPGKERQEHFSIPDPFDESGYRPEVAEEQVFVMDADGGNVQQITSAQMEDYLDGIPEGQARGNTDPDLSPDGRYLLTTNVSDSTSESWILRVDFHTGEVLNLSSMTRGLLAGRDERARFSPDGSRIVFSSLVQNSMQIMVMDPDGLNVRQLTDDTYSNVDPAWSPDGQWIIYSSQRTTGVDPDPQVGWQLIKLNVATGEQVPVMTNPLLSAFRPVWSPDGQRLAFIGSYNKGQTDIYSVYADGGGLGPLQVTLRTKESFVDWR